MQTLYYRAGNLFRGLVVKRFQEFAETVIGNVGYLEENGSKSGNDGFFGRDSEALAKEAQAKLGLTVDGVVGPKTWAAMFEAIGRTESGAKIYERDGIKVVDGREVWTPRSHYFGVRRPWNPTLDYDKRVSGVTLHQTGYKMPNNPEVWSKINAHCGIFDNGTVILMFPFDFEIWHAQDLSRFTIGIEIDGLFRGVNGRNNTHWPPEATPSELTDAEVAASEVLFTIIAETFAANGGSWDRVHAHRQSSDQRQSDPGESIWKRIGLPWIERLGATDGGPDYKLGSGFRLPKEWGPGYKVDFWGRE